METKTIKANKSRTAGEVSHEAYPSVEDELHMTRYRLWEIIFAAAVSSSTHEHLQKGNGHIWSWYPCPRAEGWGPGQLSGGKVSWELQGEGSAMLGTILWVWRVSPFNLVRTVLSFCL
jgi:hypothetical protein